jgi:hypothetical protein
MRSREQLEIAMPGSSSQMPCAPQGVKGLEDFLFGNQNVAYLDTKQYFSIQYGECKRYSCPCTYHKGI